MKTVRFSLIGCLLMLLAVGCSRTVIKNNWHESSSTAHKQARYERFDGMERARLQVKATEALTLDYEATVEQGTLTLAIDAPDEMTVWEMMLAEDAKDTVALTGLDAGLYTLQVVGDNTRGSFDVSWTIGNQR